jgi:hypothetical protein
VLSSAPRLKGGTSERLTHGWARDLSLRGRRHAVRRRRLALRVRDWLGIGVISCLSLTLFAVTFFSLIGR